MNAPLPDPAERPTLSIEEAGALVGWGRSKSYSAADHGLMPVMEVSPHRREVVTAQWLRMLGQDAIEDERSAPVDVDALADAVAARLFARLAALFGEAGPASPTDASTHDPTGPGPHDKGSHIRAV